MSNLNKALLIGRLTKDPEMRYTPSGTAVTNFSIATNRWSTGPDGERKEFTDYHNIVAYPIGKRNLAETVAQYTRKGALVFIEGRIQTRSWEGQDGQKRRTTEVVVHDPMVSHHPQRIGAVLAAAANTEFLIGGRLAPCFRDTHALRRVQRDDGRVLLGAHNHFQDGDQGQGK